MKPNNGYYRNKHWGVLFTGAFGDQMLIGQPWHDDFTSFVTHEGEPRRALLFTTRRAARKWCKERTRRWRNAKNDGVVELWRIRPVRVLESVEVIGEG